MFIFFGVLVMAKSSEVIFFKTNPSAHKLPLTRLMSSIDNEMTSIQVVKLIIASLPYPYLLKVSMEGCFLEIFNMQDVIR